MDQVVTALWGVLAAVLSALGGVLVQAVRRWAEAEAQRVLATVQHRLGEGAARVAGEIAAQIAASPDVHAASEAMVEVGAEVLAERFRDTVRQHAIPVETLAGMVRGELGKLGRGVVR
jgi:methanogenic corrinoid protein MtbC1